MHSCTGWFLGRNILQIERDDSRCTGPGMSALNATPCPLPATHNPLCLCAVGMLVSALVDQSGRPIADHRTVNLFVDDLEEVVHTRTDGARAQLETWDESASTAYKERLRKNLQYIIEHKERWTIMRHVRSRLSSSGALGLSLACCDACAQTENAIHYEPLVPKASRSRPSAAGDAASGCRRSSATLQEDSGLGDALDLSGAAASKRNPPSRRGHAAR